MILPKVDNDIAADSVESKPVKSKRVVDMEEGEVDIDTAVVKAVH